MNKLTALIEAAKAATHPVTKGRWMYLLGDRFVYDRLEDGCRGVPQVGVDHAPSFISDEAKRLQFIALANPATILELCALLEKAEEALETIKSCSATEGEYGRALQRTISEPLAAIKQWKE